jgi:hypothetical protein
MSNFFTNLVTRSLTPASNVLQPKLPSLFEAPSGGEPVLEESVSLRAHKETMTIPPALSPLSPLSMERPRLHEPFTEPNRETREMHQTILPVVPEERPRTPDSIQSERQTISVSTHKAETVPEERKQVVVPRVEAAVQPPQEKKQPLAMQASTPRLVPVLPKIESSLPIPQAEHSANTNLLSVAEPAPTVRIHIGRIEVRAVTQSTTPARAVTPNRPKMTLDEYLLRRNEGKQ